MHNDNMFSTLKIKPQPTIRADATRLRSYHRPREETDADGHRYLEVWPETIDRVINHQRWLWERAAGRKLNEQEELELEELRELLIYRKVAPAGRTLWLGGTEIAKRRESSMYNPARRDTRFITKYGVRSFEYFKDGDTCMVPTHTGKWQHARVMDAGIQPVNKITFKRGKRELIEFFTPTHTWLLQDGTRTADLKVGDKIHLPTSTFYDWTFDGAPVDEQNWWAYGFVYGDGTLARSTGEYTSRVRLCGKKAAYLSRFTALGFSHSLPPSCEGDPIVYTGVYQKTLPQISDEHRLIRAFIHGYLAADGDKNPNAGRSTGEESYHGIQVTDPETQEFVETMFPVVGLYLIGKQPIKPETNFGMRSNPTFRYAFKANLDGMGPYGGYTVSEIELQGEENVWCLTVEEDHSFTLPNGIVTGNCAHTLVTTHYDLVDVMWLLLQGCGVGFTPVTGTLHGYQRKLEEIKVIRSKRTHRGGTEKNSESFDAETGTWTITVGDSAEGWAKAVGKLVIGEYPARKIVLDFSQIRPSGFRLKGYGWISSGDAQIAIAFPAIARILSNRTEQLLRKIDILDVVNWMGTILSSRRSAEICLVEYGSSEWEEFSTAKKNYWETGNTQRQSSNNSLVFEYKPAREELENIFMLLQDGGGSEPGFINAVAARSRAPWFAGVNPCLTADTWIHTTEGARQIKDLLAAPYRALVHGKAYPAIAFWKSGHKPVFRLETSRGQTLRLTGDHKVLVERERTPINKRPYPGSNTKLLQGYNTVQEWVKTQDLQVGDKVVLHDHDGSAWGNGTVDHVRLGWLVGEMLGDGGIGGKSYHGYVRFWGNSAREMAEQAYQFVSLLALNYHQPLAPTGPVYNHDNATWQVCSRKLSDLADLYLDKDKRILPSLEGMSSDFYEGFLRGWFDADGSVQGQISKGRSVRLVSVIWENLEAAQRMLARLGIASTLYRERRQAGERLLPDGHGGYRMYSCQATHELVIARSSIQRYAQRVGFCEPKKALRLREMVEHVGRGQMYNDHLVTRVTAVTPDGTEDVYDCTVEKVHRFDANGMVVHNCAEILLGDKSFCNLTEVNLVAFRGDLAGLKRAIYLTGRMNYRQTCVDLRDGILQEAWHTNNKFLRLCGVGITGITARTDLTPFDFRMLRRCAQDGANGMARELGLTMPKNVTTIKPSGTLSKAMGDEAWGEVPEGIHRPQAKYMFNDVNFSKGDPLIDILQAAGYWVRQNPVVAENMLIRFPVRYDHVPFTKKTCTYTKVQKEDGKVYELETPVIEVVEVDTESAVSQLNRYKVMMETYVDQNASATIYYDANEVPFIVDWLMNNWDSYVGVSWCYRSNPTNRAEDLGYAYLPQTAVSKSAYDAYTAKLKPVDLTSPILSMDMPEGENQECSGGACPVR